MVGPRRLSHDSGSSGDRQDLNSAQGNPYLRSRPSLFGRWLLSAAMAGVITMGGGTMREAAAQPTVSVQAAQALRDTLVTQLTAIRSQLDTMRGAGIPPMVTFTDPNVSALLETLGTNASSLGIPITGTTREERFRSLNTWLNSEWSGCPALSGRIRDSSIDDAALAELLLRLNIALSTPGADAVAAALVPAVSGPVAAAPSAPPAAPVVVPTPVPVPAAPVPSGPVAAPSAPVAAPASLTLEQQHAAVLQDLEDISSSGRSAQVRAQASRLLRDLRAQFTARSPNTRTIEQKLRDANGLITAEHGTAVERMNTARQLEFEQIAGGSFVVANGTDIPARITAMLSNSRIGALLDSVSSGGLRMRVIDIWLLDYNSMVRTLDLLERAAGQTDDAQARASVQSAYDIFRREQAFYRFMLSSYIVPVANATRDEVRGSSLPTGAELRQAERDTHADPGTYYNVPIREGGSPTGRILRRITNGRTETNGRIPSLESRMTERATAASAMSSQAGAVSYWTISDLERVVSVDAQNVHLLVSLWNYAQGHNLSSLTDSQRGEFWAGYSTFSLMVMEPELDPLYMNPFARLSDAQQRSAIRVYLGLPEGTELSADQLSRGRRELAAMLRQNSALMYDYTVYQIFNQTRRLAPLSTDARLQHLAEVRASRGVARTEYLTYSEGLAADLNSPERFTLARELLQEAIRVARVSGLSADDPMIRSAQALFDANPAAPASARIPQASDMLYNAAISLLATRAAELTLEATTLRSSTLGQSSVDAARARVERARRAYIWNYSVPQTAPTFHQNLPARFADDAVLMVMPPAFSRTEGAAMFMARDGYESPSEEGVALAGSVATPEESRRGAAAAELRYLSFLSSLRDERTMFSPSAAESTLASMGVAGVSRALSLSAWRARPDQMFVDQRPGTITPRLAQFPGHRPVLRRERPMISPVDQHVVPMENPASADLATQPHESVYQYAYGQLYVELRRLLFMHYDSSTPSLLRGFDSAPASYPVRSSPAASREDDTALRTRITEIAREYGLATDRPLIDTLSERMRAASSSYSEALTIADPAARTRRLGELQTELNRLQMAVLDVRIAQLEARLNERIVRGGRTIRVRDLARSSDPRAYTVTRAQEMLTEAQGLRRTYSSMLGRDLYMGAREAIAITETGLESLTDERIGPIPEPPLLGSFQVGSARLSRTESSSRDRVRAIAEDVTVVPAPGQAAVPLAQWEERNGRQALNYAFFIFQNTGITDRTTGDSIYLLLDPAQRQDRELHPIGMVMRNVLFPDGHRRDAVVRVRPSTSIGSRDMPWEVVREPRTNEPIPMFPLQSGTLTPVMGDPMLNSMLSSVSAFGNRDRNYIELYDNPGYRRDYNIVVTVSGTPSERAPATSGAAAPTAPAAGQKRARKK